MTPTTEGSGTATAAEFYQRRVAGFGLVAGGLGLIFLIGRVLFGLSMNPTDLLHPSMHLHAVGSGVLLAVWLACRGAALSPRTVTVVETAGLVLSSVAYAAMGATLPLLIRPDLMVVLALTLGLVARAVFVPSSPRRTVALSLTIGVPLLVGSYAAFQRVDPALRERILRELQSPDLPPSAFAAHMTLDIALWWIVITVLVGATSQVIYGLRREVSAARRLGQYVLEEKLGEGGMGVVYRAGHAMLRRPTAVKLLPPERSSDRDVRRFEREVQLTARLTHPNTVTVFDYGRTQEGVFYYAMELLEGAPLDRAVKLTGPFPPERVLHVLHEVAGALEEAHAVGLIHRDLKPANIILCARGGMTDVPKVVDFGLVKELGNDSELSLSSTDTLAGTPLYMSPEGVNDPEHVDGRSDIYALGAVAYYLLTGTAVFHGRTVAEVLGHHVHTAPEPPSRRAARDFPADVEELVLACLAKDRGARPQSARELRARIAACSVYGRWTAERADAWWQQHGERVRARLPPADVTERSTPMATLTRLDEEARAHRRRWSAL